MKRKGYVIVLFQLIICTGVILALKVPVYAEMVKVPIGSNLQEAIMKAPEGATITLEKGIYHGPIRINKALTINGSGATLDGGSQGNVITITTDDVTLRDLTIQNSGVELEDSGVYLDKVDNVNVYNNHLLNVHNGIYIKNGRNNVIDLNTISSDEGHFSKRGNGIHIFKGEKNHIQGNNIKNVQDGIYFDFANGVEVVGNEIKDSRYGMHYMFSSGIETTENMVTRNITGFMIMDSEQLKFIKNQVLHQFHFRGFGVLIYDSRDIVLRENEIIQNSVGISFEKARETEVSKNVIAANQVGLEFRKENEKNLFFENNFIANIVSSTIGKETLNLDNGVKGNYWDDYKSYDITGDGLGELPYKAGSLYDNLLKRQPLWQFYFESPAIQMWSKAESMFPSLGSVEVYDYKPLIEPVELGIGEKEEEDSRSVILLVLAAMFIGISLSIIVKGRKYV